MDGVNAFLTGSRVYGTPRDESDIDLMILTSDDDYAALCNWGTVRNASGEQCDWQSLRFERLNIISTSDPDRFEVWRKITNDLAARAPVTKEEAIAHWELLEGAYDKEKQACSG